jgi:branched-chain amino acid transport system permease protein
VLRMIRDNEPRAVSAWLRCRALQVAGNGTISAALAGLAGSTNGASVPACLGDRRLLDYVGRGRADDASSAAWARLSDRPLVPSQWSRSRAYLAELGSWVIVTQGAIFASCVLVLRQGVYGQFLWWLRSTKRSRGSTQAQPVTRPAPLESR